MNTGLVALAECSYNSVAVRMFGTNLDPWFALTDVCEILGLGNPSRVAARLDDDEKGVTKSYTLGGSQEILIVSEPGLYNVIFQSRKPEAKAFQRWVTHEVLPSIRKYGFYDPNHIRDGKRGRPRLSESVKAQRESEKQVQRAERLKKSCESKKRYVLANGERLDMGDLRMTCRSLGASLEFVSGSTKQMITFIDEEMLRLEIASFKDIL